jgi:enoyl-CoA hydratase/carnithine racemase
VPIEIEHTSTCRTVRLTAPERGNRLDLSDLAALTGAIERPIEEGVRSIVITGHGADFCLGRQPGPQAAVQNTSLHLSEGLAKPILAVYAAIRQSPVPVIAAVRGRAVGLGCALAGTCDVTIASRTAAFSLTELEKDLPPTLAITGLLGRVMPKAIGEMVFSRRVVPADEALRIGLASRVVEEDDLDATVGELTGTLASNALRALATVKRFLAVAAYGAQPANADVAAEMIGAALAELRR